MNRSVCIHGHFYQPPRENPWLEDIELQDSAYPYHDWNMRITAECYAPNTASRILNSERIIEDIVNNYSKISFNFGPTLLSWMRKHNPETYQAVLDADKESKKNFSGHGSAIAQCYNHMIMPLANSRDKQTQVIWGIKDFEYRFNRPPEGMWLPETAVDLETLEILAENQIKFTILAPHQAKQIRLIGEEEWIDVSNASIDPKIPYLCSLPSGKTIAIFFYDGPIARDIAFGDLLSNGGNFAGRLLSVFAEDQGKSQLIHVATDGETYGHHHRFGEMALSYCVYCIEYNSLAGLTVYGEYLEKNPPAYEAQIFENSSWSCPHGVERWRNDCGCNSGGNHGWNQAWRAPLRAALDWLRDNLLQVYSDQIFGFLRDPWLARDEYIEVVLDRSIENVEIFLSKHKLRELSQEEEVKILRLLEMQRNVMLMYTSCGWFFDEISGIETTQIIQYAARAIQLAKMTSGLSFEEPFVDLLARAPSNVPEYKDGAKIYELFATPYILDLLRVGVHYGVFSLFKPNTEITKVYSFNIDSRKYELFESGKQKLAIGNVHVRSDITWAQQDISFAVFHLGDQNLVAGAREFMGEESYAQMYEELKTSFLKGDISEIMHLINKHFNHDGYSLWHLFKDEQRQVLNQIFNAAVKEIESSFHQIFEHHYPVMQVVDKIKIPLPESFIFVAEFILNRDIREALESKELNINRIKKQVDDIKRFSLKLDKNISFVASNKINELMRDFSQNIQDCSLLSDIASLLKIMEILSLDLDLWKAQNMYFSIGKKILETKQLEAEKGDETAKKWVECFSELGGYLKVRIAYGMGNYKTLPNH
ncbi:MAG: DUF3536 domain-containing protein [Candidatus Omnitrophota bacterium]